MMSAIKFFFWFWFPAPKVGDIVMHHSEVNDPWAVAHYLTIKERQGNWYRLELPLGTKSSIHRQSLLACYHKVKEEKILDKSQAA